MTADIRDFRVQDLARLLDEAAEKGARRALEKIGLHDDQAAQDIRELRGLLAALRDTRATVRRTIVRWLTILLLAAVMALIGTAVKDEWPGGGG